jgi:hypothetical protein
MSTVPVAVVCAALRVRNTAFDAWFMYSLLIHVADRASVETLISSTRPSRSSDALLLPIVTEVAVGIAPVGVPTLI